MIQTVRDDRLKELSIEQLMVFMFKDYPELISAYNWNLFPLLRANNILEPINAFKDKLIDFNTVLNESWNDKEEEDRFVRHLFEMYTNYEKNREATMRLRNAWNQLWQIREQEKDEQDIEIKAIDELVNNISNLF